MMENIIVQLLLLSLIATSINSLFFRKIRNLFKASIYMIEAIILVYVISYIQCNFIRESCAPDALAWVAKGFFFFLALFIIAALTNLTYLIIKK